MSMYPQKMGSIPEETMRIARAACPKGTLAMRLRDALGELYQDEQFVEIYAVNGQPGYAPWRLAVVTVLQYTENLTDRQAANAVRERLDWKDALGLELSDAGFDSSLLSAFRTRLVEQKAETLLLDRLLAVCQQHGWRKRRRQATHGCHACAGTRAFPLQPGMCWRNDPVGRPMQRRGRRRDPLPLRSRSAKRQKAGNDLVGVQSASDGNLWIT